MTRVVVSPVTHRQRLRLRRWLARPRGPGILAACLLATAAAGAGPLQPPRAVDPSSPPRSWVSGATLVTVYGRGFGLASVLGRLGLDQDFADVVRQIAPYRLAVHAGGRQARIGVQLIYALATPCAAAAMRCLQYLDDDGVDLVTKYIEPAARRGWLVVLDDQLGRSTPAAEMHRLLRKGYLRYDNVEVAFDPEWRMVPGQGTPGDPVGSVTARELLRAEYLLSRSCLHWRLPHRKLLLVHQFVGSMIDHQARLSPTSAAVQLAVIMDGIGDPEEKLGTYRALMRGDGILPQAIPGIKIFLPNPYAAPGSVDVPALSPGQILGRVPVRDIHGVPRYLQPAPHIVVLG